MHLCRAGRRTAESQWRSLLCYWGFCFSQRFALPAGEHENSFHSAVRLKSCSSQEGRDRIFMAPCPELPNWLLCRRNFHLFVHSWNSLTLMNPFWPIWYSPRINFRRSWGWTHVDKPNQKTHIPEIHKMFASVVLWAYREKRADFSTKQSGGDNNVPYSQCLKQENRG